MHPSKTGFLRCESRGKNPLRPGRNQSGSGLYAAQSPSFPANPDGGEWFYIGYLNKQTPSTMDSDTEAMDRDIMGKLFSGQPDR